MKTRFPLVPGVPLLLLASAGCGAGDRSASAGGAAAGDTAPVVAPERIRQLPRLANADSVRGVLQSLYPADLKARGVGGQVTLRLLVSQEGLPLAVEVQQSSGQPALDQASRQVANAMRFEPALDDAGPAKVWVTFPVRWLPAEPRAADSAAKADTAAGTASRP